jgi:FkbM family methyltransferase
MLTKMIKTLARGFGFDISRYRPDTHHDARYAHLLRTRDIHLILDVGANAGQYGSLLRSDFGYRGRILSFEPLTAAHAALTARAAADPLRLWEVAPRSALGAVNGTTTIHVAGNSVSSSILPMQPSHESAAPQSVGRGVEEITISRLDDVVRQRSISIDRHVLLKIDTQGYELEVLKGAAETVAAVGATQTEMSFQPLYGGQPLFDEVYAYLAERGFTVFDIIPGFSDPKSGRLLQADGIFVRD